jgi:PAS domain S-box-containing protein
MEMIAVTPSAADHEAAGSADALAGAVRTQSDLERLFGPSLDMLCVAAFDGFFTRVNPAFERLLGQTREALLRDPFLNFLHPDDRAATVAAFERILPGGEAVAFENRHRPARSASRDPASVRAAPAAPRARAGARSRGEAGCGRSARPCGRRGAVSTRRIAVRVHCPSAQSHADEPVSSSTPFHGPSAPGGLNADLRSCRNEHLMHALHRDESIDQSRISELLKRAAESLLSALGELPGSNG